MRIFLIGYMGCGKSTTAKALAKHLDLTYVDLDAEIEKRYGKDIPAIFETDGESHFRDLEKQMLIEWIERDNYVMACGGGTPCFFENIDMMNDSGITVYLKMSSAALAERLKSETTSRPLIASLPNDELEQFIHQALAEREDWYHKAQFTVKAKSLKPEALADFLKADVI